MPWDLLYVIGGIFVLMAFCAVGIFSLFMRGIREDHDD